MTVGLECHLDVIRCCALSEVVGDDAEGPWICFALDTKLG